jgi:hypothetical protein
MSFSITRHLQWSEQIKISFRSQIPNDPDNFELAIIIRLTFKKDSATTITLTQNLIHKRDSIIIPAETLRNDLSHDWSQYGQNFFPLPQP